MTIRVVPEARLELRDAVDYYEKLQSGLGRRLWLETDEHILWLSLNTEVPRLRPAGYRRVTCVSFLTTSPILSAATLCGLSPSVIRTVDRNTGSNEDRLLTNPNFL